MIRILKRIYHSLIKLLLYIKHLMDEGKIPIPFTQYKIDIALMVFLTIYIGVCYKVWFT